MRTRASLRVLLGLSTLFTVQASLCGPATKRRDCKNVPGDTGWPTSQDWAKLNQTVGGRLIATVPAASVCHGKTYDESACDTLRGGWDFPQVHIESSSEIMSAYFQNQSCDPFTGQSTPCTLGNYVSYAINVTTADDVKAGLEFVAKHNIRLVIKNTGHDYLGRSTGPNALSLWTHHLSATTFIPSYASASYTGPAFRLGAGVLSASAFAAAHERGLRVVGGGCPSVGLAGGYVQGGGHSLLSSVHGLASDNVLEWEVVTAGGKHVVVKPGDSAYGDLYWALAGGGGGNYAVVLGVTVRAHEDGVVGGALLAFDAASKGVEAFWEAVGGFHARLPYLVGRGATALYQMTAGSFALVALTAPGVETTAQVTDDLLGPVVGKLQELGLPHVLVPTVSKSFYNHFAGVMSPLPYGPVPVSDIISSRLIPRKVMAEQPDAALKTFREIVESGPLYLAGLAMDASRTRSATDPDNAANPAFRETLIQAIVGAPWNWSLPRSEMEQRQKLIMETIMPKLEKLTPGSGTYLNEGNAAQEGWQHEFYGANYKRLSEIKKKYDPKGIFYATVGVESDEWVVDGKERLCRADSGLVERGARRLVDEL